MAKAKVVVSARFEKSFNKMIDNLTKNNAVKLGRSIDKLIKTLSMSPESYPLLLTKKRIEIPYRKAVIAKYFIVIYVFQFEKVYLIDLFHSAQNWEKKIIH